MNDKSERSAAEQSSADLDWLRKEVDSGKPSFSTKQMRLVFEEVQRLRAELAQYERAVGELRSTYFKRPSPDRETCSAREPLPCPKCGRPTVEWSEHRGTPGALGLAKCWVGSYTGDKREPCDWRGRVERQADGKAIKLIPFSSEAGHRTGSEEE